jgi:membrane protein implicated in regulation of membrane protease activity
MYHSDASQNVDILAFQGQGTVDQVVSNMGPGRVYFKASYWPAKLAQTTNFNQLLPGSPVEIVGREGLTLLIRPLTK